MTLDEAIAQAPTSELGFAGVEALCEHVGGPKDRALNTLALELAARYMDGRTSFWDADGIANSLFAYAIHIGMLPEPMFAIYLAFDAAESPAAGDCETAELKYTRPKLREILSSEVPAA
jgi:hypothetical protein